MGIKKIILILSIFLLFSCEDKTIGLKNCYETTYIVYYDRHRKSYVVYTENETFACSFNGTNYLLEKGNTEELVSTTAPIRILKQYKFDENGNKSEYTGTY